MGSVTSAGNGLTIAGGTADLELYDGYGTWGFRFDGLSKLVENRGDGFAGQIASGGQNYDDATPFKRKVYDNFLGGFGQLSDNKVSGGVGIGGDDTKYFFADGTTDRAGYLLPGSARNLIYNTYAASILPVFGDANPNAGDEYEVPRGVVPCALSNNYHAKNQFTVAAAGFVGVTNLRVLVLLRDNTSATAHTITASVYLGGALKGTYSKTITPSTDANNYNGWTWVTLTGAATNYIAGVTYDVYFTQNNVVGTWAALGCYVNSKNNVPTGGLTGGGTGPNENAIHPYFQICKPGTATPYKYWTNIFRKAHQLLNGASYVNVAVLNSSWFNTALTNSGGSAANNPEVNYTGTYKSSIVWNNKLYIASTGGVTGWSAAQVAANSAAAPTNPLDATFTMSSMLNGYGKIYFTGAANNNGIIKWDGAFPVTGTTVVVAGTVGETTSPINRIFFYQGNLWAAKPEGMFCLYGDPINLGTPVTNTPRILPMGDPFPQPHQSAGMFSTVHQGSVFANYKDRLYMYTESATGTQVQIIPLPMPWYKLGNYHQIDGIASDGVNLYVSFNNLGVFKYTNQTWHPVTEIYETISAEPTASGLTWIPNFASGADSLYVRDNLSLVQLPMPSANSPFTRQISLSDQNKCGYLVTSFTNMEAADMEKYVNSIVLSAAMSSFCVMVRPVTYIAASAIPSEPFPTASNLLTTSWMEGLTRDSWTVPSVPTSFPVVGQAVDLDVATGKVKVNGDIEVASKAPAYWSPPDFQGLNYQASEKSSFLTDNTLGVGVPSERESYRNPAVYIQTAFIIYFWNPVPGQAATIGQDIMYIDSLAVKYQTIQDYLALYKVAVSSKLLTESIGGAGLSPADAETTWEWLRRQLGRHSPLLINIKVRGNVDPSLDASLLGVVPNWPTRTFRGFLQNPTDQYGQVIINLDTNQPLPERLDLQIIATSGEFSDVYAGK